jgi:acyl-CoA synthetase (AMP-forming)/AMP-acid ligase II
MSQRVRADAVAALSAALAAPVTFVGVDGPLPALIEAHGITFMVAVPTMALALMRHPEFTSRDLSSIRMILCGAAPVPRTASSPAA